MNRCKQRRWLRRLAVVPVACANLTAQEGSIDARTRAEAWRTDLAQVVAAIEAMHPDPFHGVDRATFERAVHDLDASIETLGDARLTVELMRLVALLGRNGREGHSGVWSTRFTHLPVQLHEFPEGVFVVAAHPEHDRLVGARVVGVGGRAITEVLDAVDPLVARDCAQNARVKRLTVALVPQVLHALGVGDHADRVRLRVRQPGTGAGAPELEVELGGLTLAQHVAWAGRGSTSLPPAAAPRHLAHRDEAFRFEWLADASVVYVQYHAVVARHGDGETMAAFAERLAAEVRARDTATPDGQANPRVVIDVRHNGGGDNTTYRPLLRVLRDDPRINRPHGLYVLIGRATFSAAGNFVTEVERDVEHALLVGEATGGSPNQYGDARSVVLRNHPDVSVRIATRYHEKAPGDPRLTHEPDLAVELTAADWLAGRDPVLETALRHGR